MAPWVVCWYCKLGWHQKQLKTVAIIILSIFSSRWWYTASFIHLFPPALTISHAFDRLRDRLVKIVTDYRTETSLRNGCNDILKVNTFLVYHLLYLSPIWNSEYFPNLVLCRLTVWTFWLNTTTRLDVEFTWQAWTRRYMETGLMMDHPEQVRDHPVSGL